MTAIGQGIDVHAFSDDPRRRRVLAGVEVAGARGLAGHSDADVVAHAVADALLGAAGLGDLGARFGVDDPEVADADSMGLLAEVVTDLGARGLSVRNVDATVVAEGPRLAPHRDAMRANLADVLATDRVSVKFTTTDRLGFLGREEGIACLAVCLLDGDV